MTKEARKAIRGNCGHVISVTLARQRLLHEISQDASHLIEGQVQVTVGLPCEGNAGKCADVTVPARTGRHLQIQRDAIHAVIETFAPDEIAAGGQLHRSRERKLRFQGSGTGVPPVRIVQPTHGRDARATTL